MIVLQKKTSTRCVNQDILLFPAQKVRRGKLSGYILGKVGTVGGDFPFLSIYLMEKFTCKFTCKKY